MNDHELWEIEDQAIREALDPQRSAVSPPRFQGNPLIWDVQRRKLDLVVSTAQRIWG